MKTLMAIVVALFVHAQDTAQQDLVMKAVRAAVAPALQSFPETDADGEVPVGGNTSALWMVRPFESGDTTIEVLANPLNETNQLEAERAMARIQRNVEAAQRRAAAQYDRAVDEARRTGRSQPVDGVTLFDEGIDGAKIDADSHVTIDVSVNQPVYSVNILTDAQPVSSTVSAGIVSVAFSSNTYRVDATERFAEAQSFVFVGRTPQVIRKGDHAYELSATAPTTSVTAPSLVIRISGNDQLTRDLLQKSDWTSLLELIK